MFELFFKYIQFPYVQYAFIVGTIIALCSSLLGVTLVLKRYSFIGDGLSHVAFGAMTVAFVVDKISNNMLFVLIVTIICAIFLLHSGSNTKIKGDAQLAMISVGSLGLGYLIMNRYSSSTNLAADVCSTLFGSTSILTLKQNEVILSVILSIVVILIFILFYDKIFAITFDENFAVSTGVNASFYNLILAIIIAVVIVLSMNLVGSLLISALIIFPALSSMRVFNSFKMVTISSAIYSIICTLAGLFLAVVIGTPVGSTIVAVDISAFIVFYLIGIIKKTFI